MKRNGKKECFAIIRVKVVAFGDGFAGDESDDKEGEIVRVPIEYVRELEFINVTE